MHSPLENIRATSLMSGQTQTHTRTHHNGKKKKKNRISRRFIFLTGEKIWRKESWKPVAAADWKECARRRTVADLKNRDASARVASAGAELFTMQAEAHAMSSFHLLSRLARGFRRGLHGGSVHTYLDRVGWEGMRRGPAGLDDRGQVKIGVAHRLPAAIQQRHARLER